MKVSLIVCVDASNGIGKQNKLGWSLAKDMKNFKETTIGSVCIMGRKTWDSIPEKFRPLSGRINIIISSHVLEYSKTNIDPNIIFCKSPLEALTIASTYKKEIFVIGGASIYEQLKPYANKLYITRLFSDFDCDTIFDTTDLCDCGVKTESVLGTDIDRISGLMIHYEIAIYEL